MANLPETPVWETGIYQLEETDPVQGGPNGIDNQQGKQLANRTLWLKQLAENLGTGKLDLSALATQAEAVAGTDNTKWMTPLRVAQAIVALATVAAASETVSGKVELATVAETITGTDTVRATHPAGVKAAINAAVAAVIDSSPTTLDTLNELAAALGDDPNFATTIMTQLGGKASLAAQNALTAGNHCTEKALPATTGNVTLDLATGVNFGGTLTGNITLVNPSNMQAGQSGILRIVNDATPRTIAYGSYWKSPSGSMPALTGVAGAVDVFGYYVESASRITLVQQADVK